MIIPTTYGVALLLGIISMICWGSWANTSKLTGKWRFELFYFDFSFGVLLAGILAAATFGSLGNEISVLDNLSLVGKKQLFFAFTGGLVFNLANILLVGAITLAGLAVAFPVGIGLALVVGVAWSYFLNPQGHPGLIFGGALTVVAAIVLDAMAYAAHAKSKPADSQARKSPLKGIVISLFSGILMGSFYPLVELSKRGELGLGPYSVGVVFALGVFASTFFYNVYFMNLPIQGPPLGIESYFRGSGKVHLLGLAGGAIWCVGAITNFVAASAPKEVNVGPAVSYALGQGATMISALWGLLYWKEFAGATSKTKTLLALMLILFLAGLGMLSYAPLVPNH